MKFKPIRYEWTIDILKEKVDG